MKDKYWDELNEMFLSDEELAKKHVNLAKIVSLVVENTKLTEQLEGINKQLVDLNKDEKKK